MDSPERPAGDRTAGQTGPVGREPAEWQVRYWSRNLRLTLTLLAIWFIFGFVLPILFGPALNNIVINGFPMGFWFAQQGSIIVFVILIAVYALSMDKLDDEFGVSERDEQGMRL